MILSRNNTIDNGIKLKYKICLHFLIFVYFQAHTKRDKIDVLIFYCLCKVYFVNKIEPR